MEELVFILLGLGLFLLLFLVIMLAVYVLAYWFIFAKAGEAGWKALIPFYSKYTEYKLIWNTRMFALYIVLVVIANILTEIGGVAAVFGSLFSLGMAVMTVLGCVKLGQSFGKGPGFIVGLVFLNPIFLLILAFDRSVYVGPGGKSPVSYTDNHYS